MAISVNFVHAIMDESEKDSYSFFCLTCKLCLMMPYLILEKRLRDAYNQLQKRGIPLASNQVNYSLIYRLPEENGVKTACEELGITIIAYSPIAQG